MDPPGTSGEPWKHRLSRTTELAGAGVVLAANAPLAVWFAAFYGKGAGDARTHARLAEALARHGLPHGWTDAYGAGFPVGPHYPAVGWGLGAALIKLGMGPMVAVDVLGLASVLAVPVLAYLLAVRSGARLVPALAGALFLSWVSPAGYFVNGCEAYFGQGLLSQVLAVPCVVLLAVEIAREGPPWRAVLWAVATVACHPQIAVAAAACLALPVVASRNRRVLTRALRAGVAMGVVGVAVYGPGIATLRVPFGWPPMETWRQIGFGPDHLAGWLLGGKLLDVGRAPILTFSWTGALAVVVARASRPLPRAVAVASVVTMALSVSGSSLQALGSVGAFLLSFLQPLRFLALVPLVGAATVLVALEESADTAGAFVDRASSRLRSLAARSGLARLLAGSAALALAAALALPARITVAGLVWNHTRAILASFPRGSACVSPAGGLPATDSPERAGRAVAPVAAWVSSVARGRLWYDDTTETSVECEFSSGFEVAAAVPIAVTSGAGAHVGLLQLAVHQLAPDRAGSARRAEALGVRHLLLFQFHGAEPPDGWTVEQRTGDVVLAEREGGTDDIGVGCIRTVLQGSDAAIRRRLVSDLPTRRGAALLLDPASWVALETDPGAAPDSSERPVDAAGCDPEGAVVNPRPREPGAFEAEVESPSPVDVVVRATAFPTWRVTVDGAPARTTTVAPGFPSVRVAPGKHVVEAVVGPPRAYGLGISLALLGAALAALWSRRTRVVR